MCSKCLGQLFLSRRNDVSDGKKWIQNTDMRVQNIYLFKHYRIHGLAEWRCLTKWWILVRCGNRGCEIDCVFLQFLTVRGQCLQRSRPNVRLCGIPDSPPFVSQPLVSASLSHHLSRRAIPECDPASIRRYRKARLVGTVPWCSQQGQVYV